MQHISLLLDSSISCGILLLADVVGSFKEYVTIDGFDYDVTTFASKHPGGGVMKPHIGRDATAAFTEFLS
jgi:hypothetical protein